MILDMSIVAILAFYLIDKIVALCIKRSNTVIAELVVTLALVLWTILQNLLFETRYTRFWIRLVHVTLIFLQTKDLHFRYLQKKVQTNLKGEKVSKMSSEDRVVCIIKFMLTQDRGLFDHIKDEISYCVKII